MCLCALIYCRSWLVSKENSWVGRERSSHAHALTLASREADSALAHHGLVALGQGGDEVVGEGIAGGLFGEKIVLNEFVAYIDLGKQTAQLSPRTVAVVTFALCAIIISRLRIALSAAHTPDEVRALGREALPIKLDVRDADNPIYLNVTRDIRPGVGPKKTEGEHE